MSTLTRINAEGRLLDIEYAFVGPTDTSSPWLVFLHEGLGSLSMWRDFPQRLCEACGVRGLVYSRPGYGRSTPRAVDERWAPDFLHRQSDVLAALLLALGAPSRYALFGHSDGGSIALIHAARFPESMTAAIVLAPHIVAEMLTVSSITATRETYLKTDLRERLARHHEDVDSAFWGWNDIWLDPAFQDWSIEPLLPLIRCPLLAVQGEDDEYGTMAQIEGIASALPAGQCELLALERCGHSPHRDRPEALIQASASFLATVGVGPADKR